MYEDPEIKRLEEQMQQAENIGDLIIFCIVAAVIALIVYLIVKSSAAKRKTQEDILIELRKLNKKEQESNLN